MAALKLSDISLKDYTLENIPLLKRLRSKLLEQKAEVCIERAHLLTRHLEQHLPEPKPQIIKNAEAMAFFLSHKNPLFFDCNLLAGTTCSKPFGAPVYPEWTGLTIWPELDTISDRKKNPLILTQKDADLLNFEIYPYWMKRNILEYTRIRHENPDCMKLMERIVFFIASKAGAISHTVPDYSVALSKGLEYIIAQAAAKEAGLKNIGDPSPEELEKIHFLKAVRIVLNGLINYAENLSKQALILADMETDLRQKENYLEMAKVCARVPAKPAQNLRQAINSLWIIQVGIHAENINMAISPGRLDQLLYPFFKKDFEKGVISIEKALSLIGCLWLKLNDNTNLVPETAEELFGGAGTVPAVTIGGVDAKGQDAVNELTYLMLRVTELLKTRDPSLNARYHYEINSEAYRNRVTEVIANTKSAPAVHNDVMDIKVLENQGVETEHARDYAIIGCVELASAGRSYDASSSIMLNLVSVLELTLYNGKRPVTGQEQITPPSGDPSLFNSFEDFWEAFKKQLTYVISQAIDLNEKFGRSYQEILPSPLLSAFFQGPLEQMKDLINGGALYNSSGATNIGFSDTVDSLNAIETAVYKEKKYSFQELLHALDDDFKGHEKLHAFLVNKTPKYGSDHPIAKKNSQNLVKFLYDFYQGHINYRGGKYRPGYWTMTNHAGQGKLSGALPNGRRAQQVFASGITPVSQAAGELTTCLKAVGNLKGLYIPGGEALNLKFPYLSGEEGLKILGQTIEAYFREGGLHVQFNIMSYDELIDAKKNPDKYPDLLVRVSGYSAYFNELNEAMKNEIITRTAYNLETGQMAPFPDEHADLLPSK